MIEVINELKIFLLDGPLNLLLFCIPAAFVTYYSYPSLPEAIPFILSVLSLAPLAERLGFLTEQLSLHTNETIGGLLNATFGNATELIVAIIALYKKLYRLVQLSLLGSILSNMLLVLGTAFLCGGMKHSTQYFNKINAQVNSVLLMVSTMGIIFPTILILVNKQEMLTNLQLSRGSSLICFLLYILLIYFQLVSHKHLFEGGSETSSGPSSLSNGKESSKISALALTAGVISNPMRVNTLIVDRTLSKPKYTALTTSNDLDDSHHGDSRQKSSPMAPLSRHFSLISDDDGEEDEENSEEERSFPASRSLSTNDINHHNGKNKEIEMTKLSERKDKTLKEEEEGRGVVEIDLLVEKKEIKDKEEDDDDDDENYDEEEVMSFTSSIVYLTIVTIFIAFLSEIISSTIEDASKGLHLSSVFISTIILPIVGNAAEHTSAIVFAMKNKLNLTLGIAIGSSTQIAMCVLPLTVLLGWVSGLDMSLEFGFYEAVCIAISIFCLTIALKDGSTNWLMGLILIAAYLIISLGFFVHIDSSLSDIEG
eukprot:gene14837-16499_t